MQAISHTFVIHLKRIKMKALLTLCVLFSALTMHAQTSITGIWNTGQENTKIQIKGDNGVFEGRLASSDNPEAKVGNLILKDVKSVGGTWKGKLYSVKKDKWFDAVLKAEGNQLLVTISSGWSSKTLKWSKV